MRSVLLVVMLNVDMLSVLMLNVVILSVIMLSVLAPSILRGSMYDSAYLELIIYSCKIFVTLGHGIHDKNFTAVT